MGYKNVFLFGSLIAFVHLPRSEVNAERTPLYVGGLFELTEHWWYKYTNLFPLVLERAFGDIRNSSNVLQDYEIRLVSKDTKVSRKCSPFFIQPVLCFLLHDSTITILNDFY